MSVSLYKYYLFTERSIWGPVVIIATLIWVLWRRRTPLLRSLWRVLGWILLRVLRGILRRILSYRRRLLLHRTPYNEDDPYYHHQSSTTPHGQQLRAHLSHVSFLVIAPLIKGRVVLPSGGIGTGAFLAVFRHPVRVRGHYQEGCAHDNEPDQQDDDAGHEYILVHRHGKRL